jgi:O-antigen/teichoic acid export membrane protein
MASLARPIISVFGPLTEFGNSVILLQILSISLLLVYVEFVFSTVIVSHDKQKQAVVISVLATIVNLTVNYFAIRYFQEHHGNGAIGAAMTMGITELFVMTASLFILPKGCFGVENVVNAGKAIFGGGVMWATIWFLDTHSHNWVAAGIAGTVTYVLALIALRVVTRREAELLLHYLPFRRKLAASGSNQ